MHNIIFFSFMTYQKYAKSRNVGQAKANCNMFHVRIKYAIKHSRNSPIHQKNTIIIPVATR